MATRYVSTAGDDTANNGLGQDATNSTNRPWRTVNKALSASVSSGDIIRLGPGVFRETATVAMTSAVAETRIIGDPRNEQGFKDGSGVLLRPQLVRFSGWTTDDKTTPSASSLLTLAGRDFLTFEDILFHGGNARIIDATTAMSTNIKFKRCKFHMPALCGTTPAIDWSGGITANVPLAWQFDQCIWHTLGGYSLTAQSVPNSASADWDLDVLFTNCQFHQPSIASAVFYLTKTAGGAFFPGGFKFHNCKFIAAYWAILEQNGWSTTFPLKVYNSLILAAGQPGLAANAIGEIVEDYNLFRCPTPRQNVAVGAHSQTVYSDLLETGESQMWGFKPQPPFSPAIDSPLLGFDSDASVVLTEDFLGRARPSGSGPTWANALKSVGVFEAHDFGRENTADAASGSCLELTGPGDHELILRVDATLQTPAYKVKYDGNYTGTNYPQIELLADASIGVSAQTLTATTAASGAYETLTFTGFTPTRKAWVRLRFKNRSAAGNGKCFIDS